MKTITIRGVEIGSGIPKIIIPITDSTEEGILKAAGEIMKTNAEAAEWRADYYANCDNIISVLAMLKKLRRALGDKILVFTLRTRREGGEYEISEADYAALSIAAAKSGYADMIDVESSCGAAGEIIEAAHAYGCLAVASFHDFNYTPSKEELIKRFTRMQDSGADITKIAVMPNSIKDVLTLLEASAEFKERYADRPFIAISMGALGAVSRVACETFGSSMTFGALGRVSAPGQLPAEELARTLDMLHS